jgi:hypothetical protein
MPFLMPVFLIVSYTCLVLLDSVALCMLMFIRMNIAMVLFPLVL